MIDYYHLLKNLDTRNHMVQLCSASEDDFYDRRLVEDRHVLDQSYETFRPPHDRQIQPPILMTSDCRLLLDKNVSLQ